jgi:hypothetical protein
LIDNWALKWVNGAGISLITEVCAAAMLVLFMIEELTYEG